MVQRKFAALSSVRLNKFMKGLSVSKKDEFLKALAITVLECEPTLTPESPLNPWDSLAIISTIAVIDDIYGTFVSGRALGECVTVADLLKLLPND